MLAGTFCCCWLSKHPGRCVVAIGRQERACMSHCLSPVMTAIAPAHHHHMHSYTTILTPLTCLLCVQAAAGQDAPNVLVADGTYGLWTFRPEVPKFLHQCHHHAKHLLPHYSTVHEAPVWACAPVCASSSPHPSTNVHVPCWCSHGCDRFVICECVAWRCCQAWGRCHGCHCC